MLRLKVGCASTMSVDSIAFGSGYKCNIAVWECIQRPQFADGPCMGQVLPSVSNKPLNEASAVNEGNRCFF